MTAMESELFPRHRASNGSSGKLRRPSSFEAPRTGNATGPLRRGSGDQSDGDCRRKSVRKAHSFNTEVLSMFHRPKMRPVSSDCSSFIKDLDPIAFRRRNLMTKSHEELTYANTGSPPPATPGHHRRTTSMYIMDDQEVNKTLGTPKKRSPSERRRKRTARSAYFQHEHQRRNWRGHFTESMHYFFSKIMEKQSVLRKFVNE